MMRPKFTAFSINDDDDNPIFAVSPLKYLSSYWFGAVKYTGIEDTHNSRSWTSFCSK